ncbi:hypothetical protein EST38_g3049 [Candolleomyces aberdarensis]|uniref:Uncharacterized protein n=1 Tax=Candolleomyces aberdarensis TaxID=2316362 RepID=A0A4Q2DT64_9AGAR|nr:hypothetical protein EST38_g3049 [Candolleomyces aberdarensis]
MATFVSTRAPNIQELSVELPSELDLASTLLHIHRTTANESTEVHLRKLWIHHAIKFDTTIDEIDGYEGLIPITGMRCIVWWDSIKRMAPTLTELDMGNIVFPFPLFKDLIRFFKSSVTLSALHLSTSELGPEVFLFTSKALPLLRLFTIRYLLFIVQEFQQDLANGMTRDKQFIQAMQAHSFAHWELEHLRIKPLVNWSWPITSCKHAIAEAFPNVKTFNGASREEYLSQNYVDYI